ncbi:ComEA family DNA-binding protein [Burkholderia multivorans]|jgi:competence protein ComEA|uniref:ComEA family DNA-binding protein n=1 Tax=Burkholderia multivorans TaxID=87883 RepID=UPI000CFEBA50|nr:helix-hairpin-helix domain-containing protein [Burkholderia multivorans]MBU9221026.1 helix-hairpin-helix domain-containing protein [Burkholderia multivorans]MBU9374871.1 helix-hairpin-helix domain-containing protein [Burkholderia multivorans]MBU9398304.1 helix-hairpin-helix domain-containing protein [Burkholderia multivorans]MBU9415830.1 helix-hairpin-helix domain-containing protein [Burkholderia multivorans]MBU9477257.1 helix-hairpin-helix domain-containing protein [Burkholderia multivoran
MIRKWFAAAALFGAFASAWAAVDVNSANEDALMGIKGIGPARAKAILDERGARGPFKDAADLASRVKGMGGHTVERLQKEGLTVGAAGSGTAGSTPAGSPAAGKAASASPAAAKPAGAPTRTAQK